MTETGKISVIVPVYNGARYLEETIRSILAQTYTNFEVLLINDGSTDNTSAIANSLKEEDSRILYFEKPNSGVSATRNMGLKLANGEFVVFFDADDVMETNFLKLRLEFLCNNPETGLCCTKIKLIDPEGVKGADGEIMEGPGENILSDILLYNPKIFSIPSNLMYRKELLVNNSITFEETLNTTADKFFLCEVAHYSKSHCLEDVTLRYRIHSESMSHNVAKAKSIFLDHELYVSSLIKRGLIPDNIKGIFLIKNYYMLGGAAFYAGLYAKVGLYGIYYSITKIKYLRIFKFLR